MVPAESQCTRIAVVIDGSETSLRALPAVSARNLHLVRFLDLSRDVVGLRQSIRIRPAVTALLVEPLAGQSRGLVRIVNTSIIRNRRRVKDRY